MVVGLANLLHVGASLEKDVGSSSSASCVELAGITRMHRMQARASEVQLRQMLHRQWDLCAAIAMATLIRVGPWNIIAVTSLPWEPHAQTPAATSRYHSLDVQTCLRASFAT